MEAHAVHRSAPVKVLYVAGFGTFRASSVVAHSCSALEPHGRFSLGGSPCALATAFSLLKLATFKPGFALALLLGRHQTGTWNICRVACLFSAMLSWTAGCDKDCFAGAGAWCLPWDYALAGGSYFLSWHYSFLKALWALHVTAALPHFPSGVFCLSWRWEAAGTYPLLFAVQDLLPGLLVPRARIQAGRACCLEYAGADNSPF
jgi:hypothetical protein